MPVVRELTPTPDRPGAPLRSPRDTLVLHVEVHEAHLANPHLAVARLLASEAQAFTLVTGDDQGLDLHIALHDGSPENLAQADAWARWAIHNAGIRGTITTIHPSERP